MARRAGAFRQGGATGRVGFSKPIPLPRTRSTAAAPIDRIASTTMLSLYAANGVSGEKPSAINSRHKSRIGVLDLVVLPAQIATSKPTSFAMTAPGAGLSVKMPLAYSSRSTCKGAAVRVTSDRFPAPTESSSEARRAPHAASFICLSMALHAVSSGVASGLATRAAAAGAGMGLVLIAGRR